MTVFTKCPKGHDLTVEGAYIYSSNGLRSCKECAVTLKKKRKGSFNLKPLTSRVFS